MVFINTGKFSANFRLLSQCGFKHVLEQEKISDKQFKIFFSANALSVSRLGIIASKRNFSKSVDRNYIKRKIRESFRQHTIKTKGLDLVVLVKGEYSDEVRINSLNLVKLFSKIEYKCAD